MSDILRRFPDYVLFSPPPELADRPPWEWKASEGRSYFTWFLSEVPQRLAQLANVVSSSTPDLAGVLRLSPESLVPLGTWFCSVVTACTKGEDQVTRELSAMSERARRMGVEDWALTTESLSIAVDLGIYLGEVFIKQDPRLRWELCTRPKRDVSYNQPVLEGGKMRLDPIQLVVVLAYGIARGNRGPNDLADLYHGWFERVRVNGPA